MNHPVRSPPRSRSIAVEHMRRKLQGGSFPRAQMTLIVLLTGGSGLLASFVLLQLGMESMALRYPLALGVAYLFFLLLIWLWLRTNARDWVDLPQLPDTLPNPVHAAGPPGFSNGESGDFGGGGATSSFDGAAIAASEDLATPGRAAIEMASAVADGDGLAVPLLAVLFALGLALASLYVVYIAPLLFAEVLVDGACAYALFRYLQGHDPQHWLASTVRHTALPFMATAVFLFVCGIALSAYAPGARTLGQAMHHAAAQAASGR